MLSRPKFTKEEERAFKEILAVTYRYLGDLEKSREMFRFFVEHFIFERPRSPSDSTSISRYRLVERGKVQCKYGVWLDMAGEHDRARQRFEWTVEDCYVGETAQEQIADSADIASAHLWSGYALLVLGRTKEACPLFYWVMPNFNRAKKHGTDIQFRKVEYFMPKLVIPLCEYLQNPGEETRRRAINGIDDFLGSFKEFSDKFDALLFCLHISERFPDAYREEEASAPAMKKKITDKNKSGSKSVSGREKAVIPPDPSGAPPGSVLIIDRETDYFEDFGNAEDVEAYTNKVREIGDYPGIIGLMESFSFYEDQEPGPLVEECTRLLSVPNLDAFVTEKTLSILNAAREAEVNDNKLMIYFQEG